MALTKFGRHKALHGESRRDLFEDFRLEDKLQGGRGVEGDLKLNVIVQVRPNCTNTEFGDWQRGARAVR